MRRVVVGEEVFFFQAEDGIRDAQESRGLGDVYKRQDLLPVHLTAQVIPMGGSSPGRRSYLSSHFMYSSMWPL